MNENILIGPEKLDKIVQELTSAFQVANKEAIKVAERITESIVEVMRSLNPALKSFSNMVNEMIMEEEKNEHLRQDAIQLHLVSKKVVFLSYRGGKVGNKNMNRIKKQMFYYHKRNPRQRGGLDIKGLQGEPRGL